jgi:tetratricopeptide (TPR) repeat protein
LAHAHDTQDLQTARETLTRAAIQAPESGPAQLALGQVDVKLGLWDDALRALQVADKLVPNEADVHFELARVYRHAGDLPKAQRETRLHDTLKSYAEEKLSLGAQARTSGNPTVRLKLARLLADHGEVPQAIAEYRGILSQTPNLAAARSELNALETRQATGSAGADAGSEPETATPSPTGASSSASIAELVRDADDVLAHHRYEAAEQAYMNILARDPNQPRATEGLGLALLNEGKNELAFKALDHAVTLDPSLSVAQYNLAHMYYNDGFLDEARRRMEPLVAKEPNNAEYLHALGMCILTESSEYLRAEQLLKHAATVDPQNPAYQRDLAKAEENLSHFPEAEQAYRKALAVLPDDPTLLASFGTFLIDHAPDATRQQEAETMLRKAVALQPKNANALLALGRIALVRHDTKEALTDLKAAVSDDPNLQAAWLHLGHAFEMVGDKQRAADCRKAFQDIVHYRRDLVNTEEQAILHPEKADVRLKLARLYSVGGQNALAINQYKVCLSLNHNDPGVQKELQVYVDRLKKSGQLPSLEILNRMVLASAKAHR